MIGGLKKTTSRFALAAAAGMVAGGLALSPANAADLGGDCCADLEERVAELEATTVRKGNRVMSLRLSGQINTMLLYWDDGSESNVYVVDNENSNSRFIMSGRADFAPGWYSRFELVVRVLGGDSSNSVNQNYSALGTNDGIVATREAWWAIGNDSLGEIQVGRLEPATDNLILINLGGGPGASADVALIGGGFNLRQKGIPGSGGQVPGVQMSDFFFDLDTARRDGIMYVSPTFFGFQLLWAWGYDDAWDVAVRWRKEWNGVQMAAGIGYLETTYEETADIFKAGKKDTTEFKGSASVLHTPTGLFAAFAWVHREYDDTAYNGAAPGNGVGNTCANQAGTAVSCPDYDYYYVTAGISKNFFGIGLSRFYGEWAQGDDALVGQAINFNTANNTAGIGAPAGAPLGTSLTGIVTTSDATMYGIGMGQQISQGSIDLYLAWRHFEYDVDGVANGAIVSVPLEDLDVVYAGARLRF